MPQLGQFEIHLVTKKLLPEFPTLTTPINLPPVQRHVDLEFERPSTALYQLPPDPTLVALAKNSLSVIRMANTQIAQLRMPPAIMRHGGHDVTLGNLNALPFGH